MAAGSALPEAGDHGTRSVGGSATDRACLGIIAEGEGGDPAGQGPDALLDAVLDIRAVGLHLESERDELRQRRCEEERGARRER